MTFKNREERFEFNYTKLKIKVVVRDEKIWDIDLALYESKVQSKLSEKNQKIQGKIEDILHGGSFKIDAPWIHVSRLTDFQKKVFKKLESVDAGKTTTYTKLASDIGNSKAARAVGRALGANPFPLLIPCHRVVPAAGGLGNYSSGVEIKKFLLEMENMENKIYLRQFIPFF